MLTLAKTCEPVSTIRQCGGTKDWSILALQNIRTGKAHYLVICTCPASRVLEGPRAQTGAPYAKVPGIRVYGMLCVTGRGKNRGGGGGRRRKARMLGGWGEQRSMMQDNILPFPPVPDYMWQAVSGM